MSQPPGLRSRRSLAIALATTLSTALATTLGTPLSISALPAAALATPLTRLELADTDVINQELRTDPVRVIVDNAFLYAFSSYAGSSPPSQIFSFQNGRFVNTTRQYPQYLRSTAWQMYQSLLRSNQNTGEVNGILAGYVAQKILLGEYQQGWDFMLAHYDRQSNWGLEITAGDRAVGQYSDFPAALRAFLIEQGYLTRQGQPTR